MNTLKRGDRVKVYTESLIFKGKVVESITDVIVVRYINSFSKEVNLHIHYKQCRKLVKKSKKEYYIVLNEQREPKGVYLSLRIAQVYHSLYSKIIKVKEVKSS